MPLSRRPAFSSHLYRAIDRNGSLIDSMLSEHRDKHAARRFLRRLIEVSGRRPARVTTDHHPAYPRAIRWIVGRKALHRRERYLL
jgi:transposase-like protein